MRERRGRGASNAILSGSVAIIVREVRRDSQGLIGRVAGHLLIEAGLRADLVAVSLVGVDRAGTTTIVERHGRVELSPMHGGRCAERLDFVIDVRRRLTPAFETSMGSRWWELRVSVGDDRVEAIREVIAVPAVGREVCVADEPVSSNVSLLARLLPTSLRAPGYALERSPLASGRVLVRSRGDWGVVNVPRTSRDQWRAAIVLFERVDLPGGSGEPTDRYRFEVVYRRPLLAGPNTLEFALPAMTPPSHAGPLLTTWYELRVHTENGRLLGARHRVEVRS